MAAAMLSARTAPSLAAFFPRLSASTTFTSRYASFHIRQLSHPLLPKLSWPIPAISLNLPSLPSLEEIWDGLLKAVPKKKVSHSRKRHRQMAGKALKDITELVRCPACGSAKRMHTLCPICAPKYANMMADLFNASKPKKSPSLSKMSEVPLNTKEEIKYTPLETPTTKAEWPSPKKETPTTEKLAPFQFIPSKSRGPQVPFSKK